MPTISCALALWGGIAWGQDGDIDGIDAHGLTTRPSDQPVSATIAVANTAGK